MPTAGVGRERDHTGGGWIVREVRAAMIDLYTWTTPNGFKASIALEELELEYRVHAVNLGAGDQHRPEYLAINPNGKIPAIVDHDGPGEGPLSVFESGAILWYLGDKTGRLLPSSPRRRIETLEWLMWQVGGVGPMFGQAFHFHHSAPQRIDYAVERYTRESERLLGVLEGRLAERDYLVGEYTVSDISVFTWLRAAERIGIDLDAFPAVARWFDRLAARPAVVRGLAVPATV
jgi:GST-like protein